MVRMRVTLVVVCALALLSGCATRFTAERVNPLRPVNTPAWEPGEITTASALPPGWQHDPTGAIRGLAAHPTSDAVARRTLVEVALWAGMKAQRNFLTHPAAAGYYLCAAEQCYDALARGGTDFERTALRFAVARLVDLRNARLDHGVQIDHAIAGPTSMYRIEIAATAPGAMPEGRFEHVWPVDRFRVIDAPVFAKIDGAGMPVAAEIEGPQLSDAARKFVLPDGAMQAATIVVNFGVPRPGLRAVTFTAYDPRTVSAAVVGGRSQTLAADFTTPFAVKTAQLNKQWLTLGILGFVQGENYFHSMGLYPGEMPRRDKIPVVFVHGLISAPNDWRFVWNELLADPVIREHYQFWAFYYPTSLPVPVSAAALRSGLENALHQVDPQGTSAPLHRMVLVGHSMGGLLARLQISQGGDLWYHDFFKKPFSELRLLPNERELVHNILYFSPNPNVRRVIFCNTPQRGSDLAVGAVGKVGRLLARLPLTLVQTGFNIVTLNGDALTDDARLAGATSIDSLTPGSWFMHEMEKLPMSPQIHKHSIIGNRGLTKGPSSDGVVSYESSHLEGVDSEKIIPSNHSGPETRECAAEIRRILLENLKEQ
jgi:pimeloyl-ACP methyl ester carboxylesterase